jgi:hypothetical protein
LQNATFSALPAVVMTVAPNALASWIAASPMPLVPPWTMNVSPRESFARSKTLFHTVK